MTPDGSNPAAERSERIAVFDSLVEVKSFVVVQSDAVCSRSARRPNRGLVERAT